MVYKRWSKKLWWVINSKSRKGHNEHRTSRQHWTESRSDELLVDCWETVQFRLKKTQWPESAIEPYRPSDRRLSAKLVRTFTDRGFHVVSVTDPYGRFLGFLDRSRYFFSQVAPQLYSWGWAYTFPDPLLRKSGSAGNRTQISGSVARNSDH
jgi:hypothetical protein